MNIESIVRQINREIVPQFEEKLRTYLADQDKDWLIEQIVRLTLDAHSLQEMDRQRFRDEENQKREQRTQRVKNLKLNLDILKEFLGKYKGIKREELIAKNFLKVDAPAKGTEMISEEFRSIEGNELLQQSKDILFGLLLLTLTMPRMKSGPLNFMKATTELNALGTWQDPKGAANDMRADNIIMEIEYGEVEGELVGDGIVTTLRIINHLEVNEEILYGRMTDVEQSTLISQKIMKID